MITEPVLIRGRVYAARYTTDGVSVHHGYHPQMVGVLVELVDSNGKVVWQRKS